MYSNYDVLLSFMSSVLFTTKSSQFPTILSDLHGEFINTLDGFYDILPAFLGPPAELTLWFA